MCFSENEIAQPDLKVGQPRPKNAADSRLSALESQIAELKSLIFRSASSADSDIKKKRPSRDLNPSRSLDSLGKAVRDFKP